MTGPFYRPADPSTTPPITDADVETLWAWPEGGLRIGEFDPPTAYGIAVLLREIERARAVVGELADIWTSLSPDQRTAIRRQSEELYNAMGVSATQRWLMTTRKEA